MTSDFITQFGQAVSGDLKWVLIAIIALTIGAMYAASPSATVIEEDDQ